MRPPMFFSRRSGRSAYERAGHTAVWLVHSLGGGIVDDPGGGNYFIGHRRWILYP